ncbi:long-chain fatty acid--CoA ligase [Ferrimonas sediminicola]|uniref:Long-chain fatty acid--CoA ligase n=1 Tax=Ferrimonas sediminicola TaxID=2569538 RepID=A0A4V5NUF9_9GAMM|nr:long-chain fatty acid--CoA ligase [Ferrimonas sediminicola]TKB46226.1 long-chain fatty acid--CoA ligase [Ferrimonas sediminicola]
MTQLLEDLHLVDLIQDQIKALPEQPAISYREQGRWHPISWRELGDNLTQLAKVMIHLGIETQDKIAIFAQNSERWAMTDLAGMQCRSVVVPIYPTNTADQARYIINDAGAKLLFVGDQEQYDKALEVASECPSLTNIILMKSSITQGNSPVVQHYFHQLLEYDVDYCQPLLQERLASRSLDDLITLIYTSGTTGEPKGVMLDYRNFASTTRQHSRILSFNAGERSLAFLPLSHVFERGWTLFALGRGGHVGFLENPAEVQKALTEFKPAVMCAVPRFYEKVYSAVADKVGKAPAPRRFLFYWALRQGRIRFEAANRGRRLNPARQQLVNLADKLVLSKLRDVLGGEIRFMPCGGAKLDDVVHEFFQSVGITLLCGYGMTETTATISCGLPGSIRLQGNGRPMPEVQVKIGDDNEILVKGDTVMKGYYNRPDDTDAVFVDGWLRTGDAGRLDDEGHLHITDRIKELMKTSNGKYIAPQRVEGMVARDPLIEQVAVVAEARNYVSALIVPAFESLESWAKEKGIKYKDPLDLIQHSDVVEHFEQRLKEVQQELAKFEQVKKFTLLPREFCMKRGELTPTLKLRRKVINERFSEEIDAMYSKAKKLVERKKASLK